MTRRLSSISIPQVDDPQVTGILEKEAALRSNWADVQNRWGLHLLTAGQWKEAQGAFERALELNPHYAWASLNLAVCLWLSGDRDGAWKLHRQTKDFQPGKAVTAAWMHLLEDNPEDAQWELHSITEGTQERPDVLWLQTAIAEASGKDGSPTWHLMLSDSLIMDDPECVTGLKEEGAAIHGLFPGFHDYWKSVSTIQARLGRFDEAAVAAGRAYIFFSNKAPFLNQMAYMHSMAGDDARALKCYEQALEECPTDVTSPQELARYYFAQDDLARAQYYMRIALDRGPHYADLQREMAQLEAAGGNEEEALKWVQGALSVNPNFKTAQLEEAYYLFCLSRWEEAAQAYRRAVDFQLQSADVYLHLGRCYEYLGDNSKAEEAYKASIKLNEAEVMAYYRLSILYQGDNKPTLANDSWSAYEELLAQESVTFPPDAHCFEDHLRPLPEHAA